MRSSLLAAGVLLLPLGVFAQTQAVSQLVGVFNIFVGAMLTIALLVYFFGLGMWVIRLGTWPSYRTVAIEILEYAVVLLFMLVVLLAIVQFFQLHQQAAAYVLSIVVVVGVVWFALTQLKGEEKKGGEKEEKH